MADPTPLRIVDTALNEGRRYVEQRVRVCLDAALSGGAEIGGYAFVVWDKGAPACSVAESCVNAGSTIPQSLVRAFVAERLAAEDIKNWAVRCVEDQQL